MNLEYTIKQVEKTIQSVLTDKKIVTAIQLIKSFDKDTYLHCKNVAYQSVLIAFMMKPYTGITEEEISLIAMGGYIHDIGKIYINLKIINKNGKLTCPEYELIKTHSLLGYQYCKENNIQEKVSRIVLEHHEKIDGSGYPSQKKENEIYIGSKIVAAVDIMDAIKRKRSYKPSQSTEEALDILMKQKGISVDKKVTSIIYNINELIVAGKGEIQL